MDKLATISERVEMLKVKLVEVGGDPRRERSVAERLAAARKEQDVLQGITGRQRTIKTLWREATPMYRALMAELTEKENQLRMLGAGVQPERK